MTHLNEKDVALVNKMLNENCDIGIISTAASLLLYLAETKDDYVAKPIVIVAREEWVAKRVYSIVNEHRGVGKGNFRCQPEEIMAYGGDTTEVMINHCHELRHHGPRFFYYKDSNAVLSLFPDKFFFVIEIMSDSSVNFGWSGSSSTKQSVNLANMLI